MKNQDAIVSVIFLGTKPYPTASDDIGIATSTACTGSNAVEQLRGIMRNYNDNTPNDDTKAGGYYSFLPPGIICMCASVVSVVSGILLCVRSSQLSNTCMFIIHACTTCCRVPARYARTRERVWRRASDGKKQRFLGTTSTYCCDNPLLTSWGLAEHQDEEQQHQHQHPFS